ncbi:aspartyl/asparaginyl beta-hydroxylase domain-containing protein [Lentisalinibacter sediminis]|uniref:aspartyl/asparaginyl beta-hydroxylase domain-containing protein n=1 Tax=Lentisalinibacter sediminis TaxID=2992237 RepID=UPI0038631DD4
MQHFRRVRDHVDLAPLLAELAEHDALWAAQPGRQLTAPAQRHTNAIPIRGLRRSRIRGRRRRDVHESRYTSLSASFPATVAFIEAFAAERNGSLGRARYARLPPGKTVLPHTDRGEYYRYRDRYHLVIRSEKGSLLRAGGESVRMREGELWWFDNKAVHDACNDSASDRIHLIFDLIPADRRIPGGAQDPRRIVAGERAARESRAVQDVARAVALYVSAREQPAEWAALLDEAGLLGSAESKPIAALARLLWPDLRSSRRACYESAIGWSLGLMDIGAIGPGDVPEAVRAAGGLEAVHERWRADRDAALYGFRAAGADGYPDERSTGESAAG